jgi:hypothetical protein
MYIFTKLTYFFKFDFSEQLTIRRRSLMCLVRSCSTLDDVFWMLPFSSKKQVQIIRQEKNVTDEEWTKRRTKSCLQVSTGFLPPGISSMSNGKHG